MSAQEIERRIPVTLLTGFLGAGQDDPTQSFARASQKWRLRRC
jgi:hypothetical protein